jgi:hypothetical protein
VIVTVSLPLLVQSPLGGGRTVRFDEIAFTQVRLEDIRSGDSSSGI